MKLNSLCTLVMLWPSLILAQAIPKPDPFKKPNPSDQPKPADAEHAKVPATWLFRSETFVLPMIEAQELLVAGLSDTALYETMLKRVEAKTAVLEKLMLLRSKPGMRMLTEQTIEYPFPTGFDPGQIPQTLTLLDPSNLGPATVPGNAIAAAPAQIAAASPNAGIGIMTSITPTTFTFKNVGERWEMDTGATEGERDLSLVIAQDSVQFKGVDRHNGEDSVHFEVQKFNTAVQIKSGIPCFLGTQSKSAQSGIPLANQDDSVTLAFVTAIESALPPSKARKQLGSSEEDAEAENFRYKPFRFQWEVFSLPKADASALIQAGKDDPSLHATLVERLAINGAKLEALQMVSTRLGQPARLQEVDEHPYPTNYNPPSLPQTLTIAHKQILEQLHQVAGAVVTPANDQLSPANGGFGFISKTCPTTFVVREMGESLEIDPSPDREDPDAIEVTLKPESVKLLATISYQDCEQPIFERRKLNTTLRLRPNVPGLVGTMNRPIKSGVKGANEEDRIWLAFLTAFDQ